MSFFAELKRRNVFRVAIAYSLIAWVVLQILDVVVGVIDAPAWVLQLAFFIGLIGLLGVVIFSWLYEMTPEGLRKESEIDRSQSITPHTGRKLDRLIIIVLVVAVGILLADRFMGEQAGPPAGDTTSTESPGAPEDTVEVTPENRSLAVLPFVAMSSGEDDEFFADGLTEEILNSLAQLPELLVTARTSSFSFKGQDIPVDEIAAKLGVKHIVEGSVRRSGDRIRVTAQLVRADDGFHLWSQNYDATSEDTIAVQEDIAEQIAVALDVVLDDNKRRAMQFAGLRDVEAFTLYQKARYWWAAAHGEMNTTEGLKKANALLEQVTERVPDFPQAYLDHHDLYAHHIIDDLAGFEMPGVSQEEVDNARDNAIRDLDLAIQYARNEEDRHSYEFDRAFIAGEWRGLNGRLDRVLAERTCTTTGWAPQFATVFGRAEEAIPLTRATRICDPMSSLEWFNEARTLFWAGYPEEALEVAQKGAEVAPGSWLNLQTVFILVRLGRFEEADRLVLTRMQAPIDVHIAHMIIAAARGDREALTRAYQALSEIESSRLWQFNYANWSGQRDLANEIAAELDNSPNRHFAFMVYLTWCACGAGFDLEVAPQFAALLESSGVSLPPSPTIEFPLNDR